jgi:RimJ/RimL family protein N-acetyltransferase
MADGTPPAYRIETARTLLRCWDPADAPAQLVAIEASLPQLRATLPWALEPPTLDKQIAFLRQRRAAFDTGQDFAYGVFTSAGEVIGGAGLHARQGPGAREIGYWIHSGWTGRGLATEIAAALTRVAFELERADRVEIRVIPDNRTSARVAEKLGFHHEATLRRRAPFGEHRADLMVWTLFADDFPTSVAAVAAGGIKARDAVGRPLLP